MTRLTDGCNQNFLSSLTACFNDEAAGTASLPHLFSNTPFVTMASCIITLICPTGFLDTLLLLLSILFPFNLLPLLLVLLLLEDDADDKVLFGSANTKDLNSVSFFLNPQNLANSVVHDNAVGSVKSSLFQYCTSKPSTNNPTRR